MKKILTLAAGALIGLSASLPAEAAFDSRSGVYTVGNAIESADQLKTGQYFIYAYSKGVGRFVLTGENNNLARKDQNSRFSPVAGSTTVDYRYVYDVTVDAEGHFTIANCDGVEFPIKGEQNFGDGNLRVSIANEEGAVPAKYALSSETVTGQAESFTDKLFYVSPTNVKFGAVEGDTPTYICTNGNPGDGHFAYYSETGNVSLTDKQYTALAFYPATKTTYECPFANGATDGKYYYLKNSDWAGTYLQLESAVGGLAGVSSDTKTLVKIIEGTGDNAGKFAIKNAARTDDRYFASNANWNSIYNSETPYYWSVTMTDDSRFVLGQTNNWFNLAGPQGKDGADVYKIWTDNWIGRVASGKTAYVLWELEEVSARNVTYNYTQNGKVQFSLTKALVDGADAAAAIPAAQFGSNFRLTETNTTVGADNTSFTVTGDWNYPVQANTVYRLALKPSDQNNTNKVVSVNAAGDDITTNVATTTTISTTALWYFKAAGYDNLGRPIFTLHPLMDDTKGVTMENVDHATATLTETPNRFVLIPCTNENKQANDFCLKTVDTNCFVNDRDQKFSTWNYAGADSDAGSLLRPYQLTEADYNNLSSVATATEIDAAKDTPTPELLAPIVDRYDLTNTLNSAITEAEAFNGTIGTDLGEYNNDNNNYTQQSLDDAKSIAANISSHSPAELREAIASITLRINQPKVGRFYRFHYGNAYMSSTTKTIETYTDVEGSDTRFAIITASADGSELNNTTVFYYDGSRLVTYPEGLVLGNLNTGKTSKINGSFRGVIKGSTYDGNSIEFVASPEEVGKYCIKVNNSRYLFHDANNIDSGSGNVDGQGRKGYRWEIEEVTWLPVPVNVDKKHFSVCVPVDLKIDANRAEAHTGVIQDSNFGLQDIKGAILPANTPAVLEYIGEAANNCVYFEITGYPEAAAAAATTSDLKNTGVYATPTHAEGQSYFTVDHESFVPHTTGNLPAFAAILTVPTEQAKETYTITEYKEPVSITEIESAANTGKQVIYDLQGRRVQRASKGLYIINGVKTLVK